MKAAVLYEFGIPQYSDFPEPPEEAGTRVRVLASALNHADILKATGTHYSGTPQLPSVTGTDGVGVLTDGRRVYFDSPIKPYGTMAEYSLVRPENAMPVPDGLDDITAAALGNAGITAWLSLTTRARMTAGESVLVLGATGAVGMMAVQAARLLGASRVIAAGRDEQGLARALAAGADAAVSLRGDLQEITDSLYAAGPADVIIDLLWGTPALAALEAAPFGARFVQIGHAAGSSIRLDAMTVRKAPVTIMGHANFQVPLPVRAEAYSALAEHAVRGTLTLHAEAVPLAKVADAWVELRDGAHRKLILVP